MQHVFAVLRVFHATLKGEIAFPESYALPKKIRKQLGGVTIELEGWSRLFSFMEWETFTELSRKSGARSSNPILNCAL